MTDTTYTVYWKHPHHGEGSFAQVAPNPQKAADWAADEITSDIMDCECENDYEYEDIGLQKMLFMDDLEVDVYEGVCLVRPISQPLASFT